MMLRSRRLKSRSLTERRKTMTSLKIDRTSALRLVVFLFIGGLFGVVAIGAYSRKATVSLTAGGENREGKNEKATKAERAEKHLYVWAGDQARTKPDFLAVVNFDENSPNYGKVITTVPLPGPGATG